MDTKKYHINPLAVIFYPEIDQANDYTTLIMNPETDEQFVISKLKYFLLKAIDENPGIDKKDLEEKVKVKIYPEPFTENIDETLEFFVKEKVVFNE